MIQEHHCYQEGFPPTHESYSQIAKVPHILQIMNGMAKRGGAFQFIPNFFDLSVTHSLLYIEL